jgi:hypothetical protein
VGCQFPASDEIALFINNSAYSPWFDRSFVFPKKWKTFSHSPVELSSHLFPCSHSDAKGENPASMRKYEKLRTLRPKRLQPAQKAAI